MYGNKYSLELREKLSISHIGQIPWNKGRVGVYSEETKQKIRESRLNQVFPIIDTKPERIIQITLSKFRRSSIRKTQTFQNS